jgi:hypothetical protein
VLPQLDPVRQKKHYHAPATKRKTITIPVSEKMLDMLESAVGQLAFKEPQEWAVTAMSFARLCNLEKLRAVLEERNRMIDEKQQEMFE